MNIEVTIGKFRYSFSREMGELDYLVLNFTKILNEMNIKYVVVSGYVTILFGRSRMSEDIDIIVEKIDWNKFLTLWSSLKDKFWCIITEDPQEAYDKYLNSGFAIRFALKDKIIPNIKIKHPKTDFENWVLNNSIKVKIDDQNILISNIEVQIAFKLYLGSEKDIEDAKHLYTLFKEALDKDMLNTFISMFEIEDVARRYLK